MSVFFAFLAATQQLGAVPTLPTPEKVVVTANGHPITAKQVEAYLWDWNGRQVAQTLAVYEIIHQEAAKNNIHVSDADVKAGIDAQAQPLLAQMPKGADQNQYLINNGFIRSQIEFKVRAQLMLKAIALLDFKPDEFVRVQTIVVRPKSQLGTDVAASLTAANAAYGQLMKGEAWDKVFAQTTTDAKNVPNQGELGWRTLDLFAPATKAELKTLKIGGVTAPVQTNYGVQIFRLEQRGKDATPEQLTEMKAQFVTSDLQPVLKRLQASAKIVNSF